MFRIILILLAVAFTSSVHANDESEYNYIEEGHQQLHCLALNVYYEARGSNLADKYAVADVVLNRVKDSRYPDSICDVVK